MRIGLRGAMEKIEFKNQHLSSLGLVLEAGRLRVLDQRQLPDVEKWLEVENPDHMVKLIEGLAVRGAPLIGVAAAMSLAAYSLTESNETSLREAARKLRNARPTAVNLAWAIDRVLDVSSKAALTPAHICKSAVEIFHEDVRMCEGMANHGASLIQNGEGLLTICNTGGLATVGLGTAFAAIRRAHDQGKNIHVYACETRPLLQGGRLTTWELAKAGIPHTLITDSMAAVLMKQGKIQRVFTGADRISARGDFANKIGTYNLAVAAHFHRVPFYTVAPWSTVDMSCASGADIPVEERLAHEVLGVTGSFGSIRWAPEATKVFNPAFDVTPAELVTGIVLDRGYFSTSVFQSKFSSQSFAGS